MSVQRPGDGVGSGWPVPTSAQLAFPHDRPRPYHLMLRTWSYAWWKPVLGVVLGVVWFLLGAALVYAITAAVYSVFEPGPWVHDFTSSFDVKGNVSPKVLLGTNLALGSLIPATWFLIRYVHRMRPRWLASVLPRMRWTFLFACLGLAVIALFVQIFVAAALPSSGSGDTSLSGSLNTFTTATAISAVVVLLTTPLQAAGEEYLFRGYLLMAVGSLFSSKWVAIVVTAVIFALAHGSQNVPLFFDRLAFGLIAAWLVTHTGGIEAGIALHVLNNFLAFGLALAYGDLTATLNVSESSWWQIPVTVAQSVVYTGLVVLVARWMGLRNTTAPPHDEPEQSTGPAVATA
jgi:uncharacterized protein